MKRALSVFLLLAVTGALACDDATSPLGQDTLRLEAVEGMSQTGVVGELLGEPLRVQVFDVLGFGERGVEIEFDVVAGSGQVRFAGGQPAGLVTAVTDERGVAEVEWILGPAAGLQGVTARLTRGDGELLAVGFGATALIGPPVQTTVSSESGTLTLSGEEIDLSVHIRDEFGNPIADSLVLWQVTQGAGSFGATSSVTNEAGMASIGFTPSEAGPFTIEALLGGEPVADGDFIALEGLAEDATGDIFNPPDGRVAPDVQAFGGWFDGAGSLRVYLEFRSEVALDGTGGPNELLGILDLDVDQDVGTGTFSFAGLFADQIEMGNDYIVTMSANVDGEYDVFRFVGPGDVDFEPVGSVAPEFDGRVLALTIPLSLLGNPDPGVDLAALTGTPDGPGSSAGLGTSVMRDGETFAVIDLVPNTMSLSLNAASSQAPNH